MMRRLTQQYTAGHTPAFITFTAFSNQLANYESANFYFQDYPGRLIQSKGGTDELNRFTQMKAKQFSPSAALN